MILRHSGPESGPELVLRQSGPESGPESVTRIQDSWDIDYLSPQSSHISSVSSLKKHYLHNGYIAFNILKVSCAFQAICS